LEGSEAVIKSAFNAMMHPARKQMRLGMRLIQKQLITEAQLQSALEYQEKNGCFLGEALLELGYLTIEVLAPQLEATTGAPFVHLSETLVDGQVARYIPEQMARAKMVLPFHEQGDMLCVAFVDPLDLTTADELRVRLKRRIVPYLAMRSDLFEAFDRVFGHTYKTQGVLDNISEQVSATTEIQVEEGNDKEAYSDGDEAPIVRLVSSILDDAVLSGTSDIHIEPQEEFVRIRFRQDGLLYEHNTLPRSHAAAMNRRLKILGHMNIAERRRPQDGRFTYQASNGEEFDLRVSILPVIYGEKIVMRVLRKTVHLATLDKLGFNGYQRKVFEKFIHHPHGIILVTGPTGSGKSTTLYAALNQINDSTRNISTIEDPVEYNLAGINQIQVNHTVGLNFAAGLRTLMRQDPDVVMVGEIRDKETAETAIQAALTGHLVFSTLHTNDAPSTIVRLQNMGIESFLVSSALLGALGQRLLRTNCANCKEPYEGDPAILDGLGIPYPKDRPLTLYRGVGCARCGGRGMKGRTAVYEIMTMSDTLRKLVLEKRSGKELFDCAVKEGMVTMQDAAAQKMLEGSVPLDEIIRVLYSE
jgi:type IV pilus assembly protein PilB